MVCFAEKDLAGTAEISGRGYQDCRGREHLGNRYVAGAGLFARTSTSHDSGPRLVNMERGLGVRWLWKTPADAPLNHLQRSVLLQQHLSTDQSTVRLTGTTALTLLGLPDGGHYPWANRVLHHPEPPRGSELHRYRRCCSHDGSMVPYRR